MAKTATKKNRSASDKIPRGLAIIGRLRRLASRARAQSFWRKLIFTGPAAVWDATTLTFASLYTLLIRLPWVIAIFVVGAIIIQGLTQQTTIIKPISVPAKLAERGYTSEVAGQRLLDAITDFMKPVQTRMTAPDIAPYGDLPKIVVPAVGISLDAILASLRTLWPTRSRTITGEITIRQDRLWLDLRIDGRKYYTSKTGADPDKPEELFAAAAQDTLQVIRPYFVAVALKHRDRKEALAYINQIISNSPNLDDIAWFYNLRGAIHREDGNYPAAKADLSTALRLSNGSLMVAHINLGLVYLNYRKFDLVKAEYETALRLDPNYAVAHNNYGVLLETMGDYEGARARYEKAIEYDANYATAYVNLGRIFGKLGKGEDIEKYRKALSLDPKLSNAHSAIARLYESQGKHSEAQEEFNLAIRADPQSEWPHIEFGNYWIAKGDYARAAAEYQIATTCNAASRTAHRNLGYALMHQGKHGEAEVEFREALRIDPTYAIAHNDLGRVLDARGDLEGAIAEYRNANEVDEKYEYSRRNLGALYKRLGRWAEAVSVYEELLAIDPGSEEAREALKELANRRAR